MASFPKDDVWPGLEACLRLSEGKTVPVLFRFPDVRARQVRSIPQSRMAL